MVGKLAQNRVLNALRQSEENHRARTGDGGRHKNVLNALRQSEENHHQILIRLLVLAQECSTPYGNQRKITCVELWVHISLPRAQRLTAIRGKSH